MLVPKILRDLFGGRDRDEYVFVMAPPKCKGALVGAGCVAGVSGIETEKIKANKKETSRKGGEDNHVD